MSGSPNESIISSWHILAPEEIYTPRCPRRRMPVPSPRPNYSSETCVSTSFKPQKRCNPRACQLQPQDERPRNQFSRPSSQSGEPTPKNMDPSTPRCSDPRGKRKAQPSNLKPWLNKLRSGISWWCQVPPSFRAPEDCV